MAVVVAAILRRRVGRARYREKLGLLIDMDRVMKLAHVQLGVLPAAIAVLVDIIGAGKGVGDVIPLHVRLVAVLLQPDACTAVGSVAIGGEVDGGPFPIVAMTRVLGEVDIVEDAPRIVASAVGGGVVGGKVGKIGVLTILGWRCRAVVIQLENVAIVGRIARILAAVDNSIGRKACFLVKMPCTVSRNQEGMSSSRGHTHGIEARAASKGLTSKALPGMDPGLAAETQVIPTASAAKTLTAAEIILHMIDE